MKELALDSTMASTTLPNGPDQPLTPISNGMPLTEYSANISPVREQPKPARALVPSDYLLPNGYPDVSDRFGGLVLRPTLDV